MFDLGGGDTQVTPCMWVGVLRVTQPPLSPPAQDPGSGIPTIRLPGFQLRICRGGRRPAHWPLCLPLWISNPRGAFIKKGEQTSLQVFKNILVPILPFQPKDSQRLQSLFLGLPIQSLSPLPDAVLLWPLSWDCLSLGDLRCCSFLLQIT